VVRLLPTVLVVALLAGTAAAFAFTQAKKDETVPIFRTRVTKQFAPGCRCDTARAEIAFSLRRTGELRLEVVRGGEAVRTLIEGKRFGPGAKVFTWNGRDDEGQLLPDGVYAPRLRFAGRTYALPNELRLDTVAPRIDATLRGRVLRYRLSERAHPLVYANGDRVVRVRRQRTVGTTLLPRGLDARITVAAEDLAGNVSRPVPVG
jgi:hypothetical protein